MYAVCPVMLASKIQSVKTLSTTEAEFIALRKKWSSKGWELTLFEMHIKERCLLRRLINICILMLN